MQNTQNTDQLWASVEQEADNTQARNAGLWARCFAQANGDAGKAKAFYMNERVAQLGGNIRAKKPQSGFAKFAKYALAGAVLLVAFFLIIASRFDDNGRSDQRATVDICWKDHKNPALDDQTKQFIAQTCNGLTEQYRAKFGSNP